MITLENHFQQQPPYFLTGLTASCFRNLKLSVLFRSNFGFTYSLKDLDEEYFLNKFFDALSKSYIQSNIPIWHFSLSLNWFIGKIQPLRSWNKPLPLLFWLSYYPPNQVSFLPKRTRSPHEHFPWLPWPKQPIFQSFPSSQSNKRRWLLPLPYSNSWQPTWTLPVPST